MSNIVYKINGKFVYCQYLKPILNEIFNNIAVDEIKYMLKDEPNIFIIKFELSDKKYIRLVYLWKPIRYAK